VYWPEGQDAVRAQEVAVAPLRRLYPRNLVLELEGVRVKISGPASPGPALFEPGWMQIPVSIPYVTFAMETA
jgi:hypothetical protein